jgi:hypothetical protein
VSSDEKQGEGEPAAEETATIDKVFSTGVALPRFGMLLPALGSATDQPETNLDDAVEAHLRIGRPDDDFLYFAQWRVGRMFASEAFASLLTSLNPEDSEPVGKNFGSSQWIVGVRLARLFTVSFQGFSGPVDIPVRFVTQMTPFVR